MIFCEIDKKFIEIIKKIANDKIVIDCGAGEGMFGSMYKNCISIDLFTNHYEKHLTTVYQMDSATFPFQKNHIPIFIRPCHHFEFVDATLRNASEVVKEAIYVSKPSNLEIDIDQNYFSATEIPGWTGKENEKIYLIQLYRNN